MADDERATNERNDTAPVDSGHPAALQDGPADLGSRIETRLWFLHKGVDRAEARMCTKFGRRDFRVYVNGQLLWSRNYAVTEMTRFHADSTAKFNELVALGWDVPQSGGQTPR